MGSLSGVRGYGRSRDLRLPRRHGNTDTQCTGVAGRAHYHDADHGADRGHSEPAAGFNRHADHSTGHRDGTPRHGKRPRTVSV